MSSQSRKNSHGALIHGDEIFLKGQNQKFFTDKLKAHIQYVLKSSHSQLQLSQLGKIILIKSPTAIPEEVLLKLARIPGTIAVSPVRITAPDMKDILQVSGQLIEEHQLHKKSFKVLCKRIWKSFPLTSMEVAVQIGADLKAAYPDLTVQMKKSDFMVNIRILQQFALVYTKTYRGPGGLSQASAGQAITLISGGFDSPVASYLMAKRGLAQDYAFFYSYPFVGPEVREKILQLTQVLSHYQKGCVLNIFPIGELQKKISQTCLPAWRTLIFRYVMLKTSELLANKIKAKALITGDALGQVSSQTLDNISFMDQNIGLSILRPLLGLNKIEIINLAKEIGTHDISLLPHDDACSLLAAKHPITRPDLQYWQHYLQENPLEQEIHNLYHQRESISF